jgi:hypothetical protein
MKVLGSQEHETEFAAVDIASVDFFGLIVGRLVRYTLKLILQSL